MSFKNKRNGIIAPPVEEKTSEQIAQELNMIRYKRALSRRTFMERVGMGSVAVLGVSVINGCLSSSSMAAGASEADVLNFALNLEYLEAEFYIRATTGGTLSAADTGAATGATTGGTLVPFTDPTVKAVAQEITFDETQHVRLLRNALGSAAVPKPAIKLDALGFGFANDTEFLQLSRDFEDTGVSAYAGAATLLTGNNLQTAAQILGTEALHTGNIRLLMIQKGIAPKPAALDSLDVPPSPTRYFGVDSNALAIKRTTSQVLSIVYASTTAGTSSGGFFPNGLNGAIKTI